MRYLTIALLSVTFLFGSSCRNKNLIRPNEPVNIAFEKSMRLYENEKWVDAANGFEVVTRIGRGSNYSQDAQYYLGQSYYKSKQYILAASEFERFVSYYPQDERREEVEYMMALCFYEQSPRYRLDQTPTRRAIELFQLFNNNYPDSEYVIESAEHIDELRNKLARKTYEAGQFYRRIDSYKAATIYYDLTIDMYPESRYAEEALIRLIGTYIAYADRSIAMRQIERYDLAIASYEKYLQLFPQSNNRAEVEELYLEAVAKKRKVDYSDVNPDQGLDN